MSTGLITAAAGLSVHLLGTILSARWLRKHRSLDEQAANESVSFPGVTVLKPLCGVDDNLEANLESFASLTYPNLQIIVGAADSHDPALAVARRVAARHPLVGMQVVVTESDDRYNPKVMNLIGMYRHARHDLCLISDSDVLARPDELQHLVPAFRHDDVGLVYQPVAGVGERSVPAALENFRLNDTSCYLMVFIRTFLDLDVPMGKAMLLRREALDSIGGFERLQSFAAEDYLLGVEMKRAGWKISLASLPVQAVHVEWSWRGFLNRTFRHSALRCRLSPLGYLIELVCNPVFITMIGLFVFGLHWIPGVMLAIACRMAFESYTSRQFRGYWPPLRYLPLMPLKDVIVGICWLPAIFVSTVTWRGKTLRLGWMTRISPIERSVEPVLSPHSSPSQSPHPAVHEMQPRHTISS